MVFYVYTVLWVELIYQIVCRFRGWYWRIFRRWLHPSSILFLHVAAVGGEGREKLHRRNDAKKSMIFCNKNCSCSFNLRSQTVTFIFSKVPMIVSKFSTGLYNSPGLRIASVLKVSVMYLWKNVGNGRSESRSKTRHRSSGLYTKITW